METTVSPKLDFLVLVAAFATSEGFFVEGSVPQRCANPTDLRFAGQEGSVPSQYGKPVPFAQFKDVGTGIAAAVRQMCAYMQKGFSLRKLVYTWAPPTGEDGGNNSALYLTETIRRIKAASGVDIDPDTPLTAYLHIERIP